MLQEILLNSKSYIDFFFEHLDLSKADKILKVFQECQGTIFFTGVGKSGYIAKKVAVTFTSTGTKALFISPTDALHGDIGIVNPGDIFVIYSKSGESEEALNLIPYLRNKGILIIGIASNPKSRLSKASDFFIELPLKKELCPFDIVPTTSTTIQLIFGDALAVALMKSKNFTKDEYALNHPAGAIGKKIVMKVKDLMLKGTDIPLCFPQDKLKDILVELSDKKCGCVLVVDHQQVLKGIFTDGDLRRALQVKGADLFETPISQIMSKEPKWITSDVLAFEAVRAMEADQKRPITVLAVLDEGHRVLGLIKMHDIVQSGI